MNKKLKEYLFLGIGVLVSLLIFQIVAFIINDNYIFPNPFEVLTSFFKLFSKSDTYINIGKTLLHLVIAILISFLLGSILGVLGTKKEIDTILKPTLKLFKSLPIIALILILLLFIDNESIPVFATVIILTPIFYDGIREGILSIDNIYIDVYRLESSFNLKVFLKVYLPLTMASLKTAFRAATGLGIKSIVASEYLAGVKNTLGKALTNSLAYGDFIDLYSYSLLMAFLVLVIEALVGLISYFINQYHNN